MLKIVFLRSPPNQIWHIASVSKILSPGLSVAWLRAPGVRQACRFAADIHETAIMAPPLNTAIVCGWIDNGLFERMIGEVRAEARTRLQIVRKVLPTSAYKSHEDGYHLWLPLTCSPEIMPHW